MYKRFLNLMASITQSVLHPEVPKPLEEKSTLEQCFFLLNGLNVDWFSQYAAKHGVGVNFPTVYPNIDIYTVELISHFETIRGGEFALPGMCRWDLINVTANQFFASHDGYYQNVHQAVSVFQQAALRLCEALMYAENVTHVGWEYNQRLLTPLLLNLKDVILSLTEISMQK